VPNRSLYIIAQTFSCELRETFCKLPFWDTVSFCNMPIYYKRVIDIIHVRILLVGDNRSARVWRSRVPPGHLLVQRKMSRRNCLDAPVKADKPPSPRIIIRRCIGVVDAAVLGSYLHTPPSYIWCRRVILNFSKSVVRSPRSLLYTSGMNE